MTGSEFQEIWHAIRELQKRVQLIENPPEPPDIDYFPAGMDEYGHYD